MSTPIKVSEKEMAKLVGNKPAPTNSKIKIAGNAIVLTSKLKFDTIQKMEKYNRNALCLVEVKNDEENEIFRISTGKLGSISKFGVVFTEANKDGFATATVLLPEGVTNKKEWIKDNYATTLFMLADLEDAVETACAELEAAYAKIDTYIEEV